MVTIHEDLREVQYGDTVECRIIDGSQILGACAASRRDQGGIRMTLWPVDASRVPHRVCQPRGVRKWLRPYLERWDETDEDWQKYGEVVEFGTRD